MTGASDRQTIRPGDVNNKMINTSGSSSLYQNISSMVSVYRNWTHNGREMKSDTVRCKVCRPIEGKA